MEGDPRDIFFSRRSVNDALFCSRRAHDRVLRGGARTIREGGGAVGGSSTTEKNRLSAVHRWMAVHLCGCVSGGGGKYANSKRCFSGDTRKAHQRNIQEPMCHVNIKNSHASEPSTGAARPPRDTKFKLQVALGGEGVGSGRVSGARGGEGVGHDAALLHLGEEVDLRVRLPQHCRVVHLKAPGACHPLPW